MSQGTPNTVETLQTSLQAKAKTEAAYRFYSPWDKICREDVLAELIGAVMQLQVRQERMGRPSMRSRRTE
jgi:hypothetical protein